MTAFFVLLALTAGALAVFRCRVGGRHFSWRTWASLAFGAAVGFGLISFLEPFLSHVQAFHLFPVWMWKLGMAVFGAFSVGPSIRAILEGAIPPPRNEQQDDPDRRRFPRR